MMSQGVITHHQKHEGHEVNTLNVEYFSLCGRPVLHGRDSCYEFIKIEIAKIGAKSFKKSGSGFHVWEGNCTTLKVNYHP